MALLLQTVWDLLAEQSRWPTYGHVDRRLYQGHGLDVDRLLLRTPDTLLVGGRRQGGAEANPDEQLRLTVAGVAACSGTVPVVAAFLRAVQTAVRLETEHTDVSEPSLTADQVMDDASDGPSRPNPVVGELALQVGLLLSQEWGWLGSCQLYEGGWRIGITRRVRAYRGVASLEDYWTRRERARHTGEESLAVPRQGLPSVVVSPAQAIAKLEELRAQAQSQDVQREGALHDAWRAKVDALMATVLGPASGTLQSFRDVNYHIGVWTGAPGEKEEDARYFASQVERAKALIDAAVYELEFRASASDNGDPAAASEALRDGPIFVVHGRDNARKYELVRLLDRTTDRDVQVLHEQVNSGATILEKLERHVQAAGYAVVLLTGDDEGRLRGRDGLALNPRGRQNVILELGVFLGSLGRSRVAVLFEDGVELPSDLEGLVYIPLDSAGGWRVGLLKELAAAGIAVDYGRIP